MDTLPLATSPTRLADPLGRTLRRVWIVVIVVCSAYYLTSVVWAINAPPTPGAGIVLGTSPLFRRAYFVVINTILFWSSLIMVWIVGSRRSDDWLALLVTLGLFFMGITVGPELIWMTSTDIPFLTPLVGLFTVLGFGGLGVVFLIFPDGRFVPGWSRWVGLLTVAAITFTVIQSRADIHIYPPFFMAVILSWLITLGFQIYRFRRVSTPIQRQQTKWVVLTLAVAVIVNGLTSIPGILDPALFNANTTAGFIYQGIRAPILMLTLALIPIGFTVSLVQYRLWDVDYVINRSLVYGVVTVLLGGLFAISFFVIRAGLLAVGIDQDLIAAALPAVAAASFFVPTRRRVKLFIDRQLYGIGVNYSRGGPVLPRGQTTGDTAARIEGYKDIRLIGRGGMGDVYRGHDGRLDRPVAIKVLAPRLYGDSAHHKRFLREAQTTATLKHPHIADIYDVGEVGDRLYMVMEYLEGRDWSEMIRDQGALMLEVVLPRLREVGSALDYAHGQGVIHRDVKPANVMITETRAVLMDFGIAKIASALTSLTGTAEMMGTLGYVSPEQIQDSAHIDYRADIYSMGAMTFHLLTGNLPFPKRNPGAIVIAHLMEPCPVDLNVPEKAMRAIQRAMSKQPDQRFATVSAFVDALA